MFPKINNLTDLQTMKVKLNAREKQFRTRIIIEFGYKITRIRRNVTIFTTFTLL